MFFSTRDCFGLTCTVADTSKNMSHVHLGSQVQLRLHVNSKYIWHCHSMQVIISIQVHSCKKILRYCCNGQASNPTSQSFFGGRLCAKEAALLASSQMELLRSGSSPAVVSCCRLFSCRTCGGDEGHRHSSLHGSAKPVGDHKGTDVVELGKILQKFPQRQ